MAITINGSGSITGLSAGGLPDSSITSDDIASGAVTQAKLATGVAGTAPAFSAYQSSTQTLSSNTVTKIQFQTEEWDTANCFDSATNYRFAPNVAGYYIVNASVRAAASFTTGHAIIYKNGTEYKLSMATGGVSGTTGTFGVSCQVYLNGSTDYIECYGILATGQALTANSGSTWFQASMVRAA